MNKEQLSNIINRLEKSRKRASDKAMKLRIKVEKLPKNKQAEVMENYLTEGSIANNYMRAINHLMAVQRLL